MGTTTALSYHNQPVLSPNLTQRLFALTFDVALLQQQAEARHRLNPLPPDVDDSSMIIKDRSKYIARSMLWKNH